MVSTPFFHSHCFHVTKAALTSSINLMPERTKSPSGSSPALSSSSLSQTTTSLCSLSTRGIPPWPSSSSFRPFSVLLQGEEALVSWRIWPRAPWCLFKRHPVEGTVCFPSNQKCPANSVCPMLKALHPNDSKESHPDHSDEGNIYPVISDLNIISALAASCKLFCNLPHSVWYLDSVCKWQIEGWWETSLTVAGCNLEMDYSHVVTHQVWLLAHFIRQIRARKGYAHSARAELSKKTVSVWKGTGSLTSEPSGLHDAAACRHSKGVSCWWYRLVLPLVQLPRERMKVAVMTSHLCINPNLSQ